MNKQATRSTWLLAALLTAGIVAALAWPDRTPLPARPPPPPVQAPGVAPNEPAPDYTAPLLARPLFTPGRRPDPAGATPAMAALRPPEPPRLTGILVTRAGRSAIFAAQPGGLAATVVKEGSRMGPWRVDAIHTADVQLSGPDGQRTVRLAYSDTAQAGAPAAQLPPAFQTDTAPSSLPTPPGFANFFNAPALPAARTPP